MNLKLYYQDNGIYGSIVVISDSIDNARNLMELELNYDKNQEITEFTIKNELILTNIGDM